MCIRDSFRAATEQPFLSQAGSGIVNGPKLDQWLAQDSYISRGYITFVGALIGKIRLPQVVSNTQFDPLYRATDLLISALNNVRREMSYFEISLTKFNLRVPDVPATPNTKAYLDLLVASSAGPSSLLEGMVVLWATHHVGLSNARL